MSASSSRSWTDSWNRYWTDAAASFNRFWFLPRDPWMLGLIRLLAGLIALYTHFVWTFELQTFFGSDGLLPPAYRAQLMGAASWSHLDFLADQPTAMMAVHGAGLVVLALFAVGCWTRVTSILAALLVISYANRSIGAGFGLDQINVMLCLYCALGNSGGSFSMERWWRQRSLPADHRTDSDRPDTWTNLAIRLIQIHLCVIYLFGGLSKARGQTWWDGTAMWGAVANYEYQSMDTTWIVRYPRLFTAMTHLTLFWEIFYCALVWPRLTRPIAVGLAVIVHAGIAVSLGMITFGTMMIAANMIFVEPTFVLRLLGRSFPDRTVDRAGEDGDGPDGADLSERERRVEARERELDSREQRLSAKKKRVKGKETEYRDRVKRLKDREEKIKSLVERNRGSQASSDEGMD